MSGVLPPSLPSLFNDTQCQKQYQNWSYKLESDKMLSRRDQSLSGQRWLSQNSFSEGKVDYIYLEHPWAKGDEDKSPPCGLPLTVDAAIWNKQVVPECL